MMALLYKDILEIEKFLTGWDKTSFTFHSKPNGTVITESRKYL